MNYYNLVKKVVEKVGIAKVTKTIVSYNYPNCYTIYLKNGHSFMVSFKIKTGLFFDNGEFMFGYKDDIIHVDDYYMKKDLKELVEEIYFNYLSEKWNEE